MSDIERHSHWQNVYQTKGEQEQSRKRLAAPLQRALANAVAPSRDYSSDKGAARARVFDRMMQTTQSSGQALEKRGPRANPDDLLESCGGMGANQ
jgi:hypothetical protein